MLEVVRYKRKEVRQEKEDILIYEKKEEEKKNGN